MKTKFILLAAVLLAVCLPVAAHAATDGYAAEALAHLEALELLPEGFDAGGMMTRGGFAQMVYTLMGRDTPVAASAVYYDVSASSPDYTAVSFCVQSGYMGGADGYFRPEEVITHMEALTVFVRVLGYTDYAESNGGYPTGYYAAAKNAGLLYNTGMQDSSQAMTCENAAALVYNALRCSVNTLSEVNQYYYSYTVGSRPLVYEVLGLNYTTGVMTSNGLVDVSGSGHTGVNMMCVDGVDYRTDRIAESYMFNVGQRVSLFYDDDRRVASAAVQAGKNNTLRINRGDYLEYTGGTISSDDGSGTVRARLAEDAVYLLNGQVLLDYESTGFADAEYADLYLIDNDGDTLYDYVFVNSYKTFVAGPLDEEGVLYSIDGQTSADLRETALKTVGVFTADGAPMDVADIPQEYTVSILENENFVYVICFNGQATGTLRQKSSDSLRIDNLDFKISNEGTAILDGLTVGTTVSVYFDFAGRLVYASVAVDRTGQPFGFLVNYEIEENLGRTIRLKLFTRDGEMEILPLRNKFSVNETTYTASKLSSLPDVFFKDGVLWNTVILYNTNDAGEITSITFPQTYFGPEEDGFFQAYSRHRSPFITSGSMYGRVFLNKQTAVFVVPNQLDEDEKYAVTSISAMKTATTYTVDSFHFSKNNGFADVLVVYGDTLANTYNTPLSVIMSVGTVLDDSGEERVSIKHLYNDAEVTSFVRDEALSAAVQAYKPGDAVRLTLDTDGEIKACERVYDYTAKTFSSSSLAGSYPTHSLYLAAGYVAFNDNTLLRLSGTDQKDFTSSVHLLDGFLYTTARVILVESSARGVRVSVGQAADVQVGDYVVIQSRSGTPRYLVLYREVE